MTSKHHSAQTEQSKLCRDNTYDSPILRKHFYLTLGSPKLALRVYEVEENPRLEIINIKSIRTKKKI